MTLWKLQILLFLFLVNYLPATLSADEDEDYDDDDDYESYHSSHQDSIHEDHYQDLEHVDRYDHLAILGSKALEEAFEHLAPAAAQKRLDELIGKMDTSKDGFISKEELSSWIVRSFASLDEEEAKEKLREADANRDGKVSWVEFLFRVYGFTPDEIPKLTSERHQRRINATNERFRFSDRNNDSYLSGGEYPNFLHPQRTPAMQQLVVKHGMQEHDRNGDGRIGFEEFSHNDSDSETKVIDRENFNNLDFNKDGFLNGSEFRTWLIPNERKFADQEADHLVKLTDTNRDKKLSRAEILSRSQLWVGGSGSGGSGGEDADDERDGKDEL